MPSKPAEPRRQPTSPLTALDRQLIRTLELAVLAFGTATLAYHLTFLARAPAHTLVLIWPALALPAAYAWRRSWPTPSSVSEARTTRVTAGLLALVAGGLALLLARPDLDDYSFFHRAVAQLEHLDEPFLRDETSHGMLLPPLSNHHLLTAYEPLVALAADRLGLDPILLYQNGAPFLAGILLIGVWLALYRHVGLDWWMSLTATATALAFHLLDGGPHRSFGNFGIVRLWHGKAILATVVLPLVLLLALRFLRDPSLRRWSVLALAAVSGVGLSSSAIFLIPALAAAVGLAHLTSGRPQAWRQSLLIQAAVGYASMLGLAIGLDWLPRPIDSRIWTSFPEDWWQNVSLVVGGRLLGTRDLAITLALPMLVLAPPFRRLVPMISLALVAIFTNPWTGPLWLHLVEAAAYWRFVYLLPVTWCAGLLAAAFAGGGLKWQRRLAVSVILLLAIAAFPGSTLAPPTFWHRPWAYKFSPRPLDFALEAVDRLAGRRVLAPPAMVILPLMDPSITLVAGRPFQTLHSFRNLGREAEGERRLRAQALVVRGGTDPALRNALDRSLDAGVDALIVRRPALADLRSALEERRLPRDGERWFVDLEHRDFILLLQGPPGEPTRRERASTLVD